MAVKVDYTQFHEVGPSGSKRKPKAANRDESAQHWWQATTPEARARAATGAFRSLKTSQSYRETAYIRHSCLYGVSQMRSLGAGYSRDVIQLKDRVPQNIVRQAIDTRRAKVCKNRPRPTFVTSGGNWKQQQKARALNKFCQGMFYEVNLHEIAPRIFLEADISGTGVLKVFEDAQCGRMRVEQVLATELYVDELEAINGEPRQLFQFKLIAREVLLRMFPDHAQDIRTAKKAMNPGTGYVGDMVEVVEAWHLPSGEDTGDGLHGIYLGEHELHTSEWEKDRFPFVFFRPDKPHLGFWGKGVAEVLMGYQLELNRISKRIQDIMRKCSVPRTYVPRSAKIPRATITNDVDTIIQYDGETPPHTVAASYVPSEYFQERRQLKLDALNEVGVSEMDVMSTKPAGLDSAPSLREYEDVKSERLSIVFQQYEQFFLDVAYLLIDGARCIANREAENDDEENTDGDETGAAPRGYRVSIPDKKRLDFIDWKDIDLDEDEYVMQAYPTNSLPTNPSARKDALVEWMQLGLINGAEFRRLMDMPDLEESTDLAAAALDDANWTVTKILEDGKAMMPEPQQDLQLLMDFALSAYRRARHQNYPRRRVDNLLSFIANTQQLLQMAEDAAMQKQAALAPPSPDASGIPGAGAGTGIQPVPPMPGPMAQAA